MTRAARIVTVTVGLAASGALFGAMAGVLALVLGLTVTGGLELLTSAWVLQIPAYFGAVIGALGLPAVAWLLLRNVPLGRAIAGSVVGTVIGGAAALPFMGDQVFLPIGAAFLGFVAAAFLMRRAARSRAA
jgi:hypothetical protein